MDERDGPTCVVTKVRNYLVAKHVCYSAVEGGAYFRDELLAGPHFSGMQKRRISAWRGQQLWFWLPQWKPCAVGDVATLRQLKDRT